MDEKQLRKAVLDELDFEPSIDATSIGLTAHDGVVTLTGYVSSCVEKIEAQKAVRRIKGVRAIADEINVRYANDKKTSDDEIAKRALDILGWYGVTLQKHDPGHSSRGMDHTQRGCDLAVSEEGS